MHICLFHVPADVYPADECPADGCYESILSYQVTISDGGDPNLSTSVQVWITVEDENDNIPMFESFKGKIQLTVFK